MDEVDAILSEANAANDGDQQFKLLVKAAELCLKLCENAKANPPGAKLFRAKANSILKEAERLKASKNNHQPSAFSMANMSSSLPPPKAKNAFSSQIGRNGFNSFRTLTVSEQKLLWLSSLVNGHKFPPATRQLEARDFERSASGSQFEDNYESNLSNSQRECFLAWLRPSKALPPPLWFPNPQDMVPTMDSERPIDLMQDITTDCSVVASLCSERARVAMGYPSILSTVIFPYDTEKDCPKLSPSGRYLFRFNFNGCYRFVEIDDRIPVSKKERILHIIDSNNPCLLWPALLEKAYLKVRGGYDFPGSNTSTDLWIITGWIPEILILRETDLEAAWKRILTPFKNGNLFISVGTGQMSKAVEEGLGLISRHNYTILDLKKQDHLELVLVKNPWCKTHLWNDGNFTSTEDFETKAHHFKESPLSRPPPDGKELAPGTFWITLNDLFQNFENLYLNWNPRLFAFREEIHFEWDLSITQKSYHGLARNPQFSLSSNHDASVWLVLWRHFKRDIRTGSPRLETESNLVDVSKSNTVTDSSYISLFVFDNGGQRVYNKTGAVKYSPYLDSPQTLLRLQFPRNATYTVAVSEQDLPADSHYFSLIAYSLYPTELSFVKEKYRYSETLKEEFTYHNSGGGPEFPSFSINPQWKLEVLEKTQLAILLESAEPNLMVNVRLCYGGGKRLFMLKRRDTVLDSGEYGKGGTFAQTRNVEIEKGIYTVIASTFQPKQFGSFLLRVDADSKIKLSKIPREDAGKFILQLPKAVFRDSATRIAIPLTPVRVATLNIVVKFDSTYSSHQVDRFRAGNLSSIMDASIREHGGQPLRSSLRISLQIGRGPESKELAASCDGEFSDATDYGLRIFDRNVWPDLVLHIPLFLVLERQGKGLAGTEERYLSEYMIPATDGYDAIQSGQWEVWED